MLKSMLDDPSLRKFTKLVIVIVEYRILTLTSEFESTQFHTYTRL